MTRQDRKQLNMSVTSTAPEMTKSKNDWASQNGVTITEKEDMDIDSFKEAVDGIDDWFVNELKSQGYDDAQDLVDLFHKGFLQYSGRLQ